MENQKPYYTVYIDFAINNSQTFDPMNSPDEVLEARKINAVEVGYADDFHNLFLHLAEQFNEQTVNIDLKDKVNLKIVRNDEYNYFIVYYEYVVDNIRRLPIKTLDNYLNIIIDKIFNIVYGLYNALEINLSIPDQPHPLSLSWNNELCDLKIDTDQEECMHSSLSSSHTCKTDSYGYMLDNGWVIEFIFKYKDETTLNVK